MESDSTRSVPVRTRRAFFDSTREAARGPRARRENKILLRDSRLAPTNAPIYDSNHWYSQLNWRLRTMIQKRRMATMSVATLTVAALLNGGFGLTVAPAHAAPHNASSSTQSDSGQLTKADWKEIQDRASAAGDAEGAKVAEGMSSGSERITTYGLGGAAKKAAIIALKYGKEKLPASIRPYAGKIVQVLEEIDNIAEAPIAAGLQQAGMDPTTAATVSQQVVLWLSVFGPV